MAAEVTSLNIGKSEVLTTRDLLGSLTKSCKSKLDTELPVPDGLDKHLDSKWDKVYSKACPSPISSMSSSSSSKNKQSLQVETLQDLNYPPTSSGLPSKFLRETWNLDSKLDFSSRYQSVCTLDKVKSALERAEKHAKKKHQRCSSISALDNKDNEDQEKDKTNSSNSDVFATGCPGCLSYVMTLRANPKCPRCNFTFPYHVPLKEATYSS